MLAAAFFTRKDSRVSKTRTRQYAERAICTASPDWAGAFAAKRIRFGSCNCACHCVYSPRGDSPKRSLHLRRIRRLWLHSVRPRKVRAEFACAQKWLLNSFALPLNVRILRFWRIALGGGISMTPARRNCRARSRTRIGYSTPFIDSSFAVGIEPFERGAESRLGDRGLGCCRGDSAVLE